MAAVGAYYALQQIHVEHARRFLRVGVTAGLMSSVLVAFPTGDRQAKLVARYQPVSLAAMEGRFESGGMAGIVLIGQPNLKERRLDNPIVVPGFLSFLAYGTFHAHVAGLDAFPQETVAGQHRAALLRVPHDGGARDAVHRRDGDRLSSAVARSPPAHATHALDPDAGVSVSLHRHHGRLDDRGAGPTAVDRPRPDANRRRREPHGRIRHRRSSR